MFFAQGPGGDTHGMRWLLQRKYLLPQGQIPLALLFFNVGVEQGQLLFIGAVLSLLTVLRRMPVTLSNTARQAASYAIGSVAMLWVIRRVSSY